MFEKYVQKGNEFINEVALELGIPDNKQKALRILKAVLHTLRNNITPEESVQLIAQLPMFIKALYVDNWKITDTSKRVRRLGDFLHSVREEDGISGSGDFASVEEIEDAVKAVFTVLKRHVSEGEIFDIRSTLPSDLKPLLA